MQSEKNIWWQSAWALPHESRDTLRWYFERARIKHIISFQVHGQNLQVSGIGNFDIEWNLGGDLKTLKCMLGCKGGVVPLHILLLLKNTKKRKRKNFEGF